MNEYRVNLIPAVTRSTIDNYLVVPDKVASIEHNSRREAKPESPQ
jgi:hypothetical protein